MEERIQRKVEELKMKPSPLYTFFKPSPTYEALREEAMRIVQEELTQEENLKNRMKQHQEEREKLQESMQRDFEKRQQEKKEEEEREQLRIVQQREDPDKPLTIKDIRAIPGFDYNDYKRALEELNVEMLKRIARETYKHKFRI